MSLSRRRRWLLASFPVLIAFWTSFCFVFNHFMHGPYLRDAGWYSAILYRQGFFPHNPPVATTDRDFYAVHVDLVVSLASLLSYVFPGDRIDWYCLFQGAIYTVPVIAVFLLARGTAPVLALGVALAFAFNGQTLACLAYPHHEVLLAGAVCLVLAGLATDRARVSWVGLALALASREDGGLHAAAFLAAVLLCRFPAPRRRVLALLVVAIAGSLLCFAVQRSFFHSGGIFESEYIGHPPLAHLKGTIGARFFAVLSRAQFVVLPLAGTAVVAVAVREPRVLLGWLVEMPWLIANVLAKKDAKAILALYTGFPFIVSMFWVAAFLWVTPRRRAALPLLAGLSLLATAGFISSYPDAAGRIARTSLIPELGRRAPLLSFARALRADELRAKRTYVDLGMASWALESLPAGADVSASAIDTLRFDDHDALAFFRTGLAGDHMLAILARSPFARCGRIPESEVYFCTRPTVDLPFGLRPSSPLLRSLTTNMPLDDERIIVPVAPTPTIIAWGPYVALAPGAYRVHWTIREHQCHAGETYAFDVAARRVPLARREVQTPAQDIELSFVADGAPIELRAWSGACGYEIRDVKLDAL